MSRLIVPAFKHVVGGSTVDRSLDVEDVDAALAQIAKALNGGISEDNFAASLKFANGATASTVQSAWEKTSSLVTLTGQAVGLAADLVGGVTSIRIGETGAVAWTPVSATGVILAGATVPRIFIHAPAEITAGIDLTPMTAAEKAAHNIPGAGDVYTFSCTSFLSSPIPAGTAVFLTSSQPIWGPSTVLVNFTAANRA